MESLKTVLSKLESNPKVVYEESTRLLIKIADNILKEPSNTVLRNLRKNNNTISSKLLDIYGGLDCLKLMGFEESNEKFTLPSNASLENLTYIRNAISKRKDDISSFSKEKIAELFVDHPAGTEEVSSSNISSSDSSESLPLSNELSNRNTNLSAISTQTSTAEIPTTIDVYDLGVPTSIPTVTLPPMVYYYTNPFLRELELSFHMALAYADKPLIQRALKVIPKTTLYQNAQERMRELQGKIKEGKIPDPNITMQEMLLLELLAWFKEEFFTWVDNPPCKTCSGKTKYSHMCQDPKLLIHTARIEMHKCLTCDNYTPFPRYNDVNILLITRKGRCGEWANTFTLFSCAMGWDARFVVDKSDHVWTEVYSIAQKRWLHCDPCENLCDTPLIYENGWGKKMSYAIAYSAEEIQDVTWRYSSDHKEVLKRRSLCPEADLIDTLITLRKQRQKNFTTVRRNFLSKRLLTELMELMIEKKPNDTDKQGRMSGSASWRLARGEIQEPLAAYTWLLKPQNDTETITIQYSTVLNCYECLFDDESLNFTVNDWRSCCYHSADVFRKIEKDWEVVYLARTQGSESARVSWKFAVESTNKVIDIVSITFAHKIFKSGEVRIEITSEDIGINFPQNVHEMKTTAFSGCSSLIINAQLSKGEGDVAWQHSQLFRQSLKSREYPFIVKFKFKSI